MGLNFLPSRSFLDDVWIPGNVGGWAFMIWVRGFLMLVYVHTCISCNNLHFERWQYAGIICMPNIIFHEDDTCDLSSQ